MKKALLHYNQIQHLPNDYQQRIKDLADFYQQLPYDHDYHESWCDDLDQGFSVLDDVNPEWVVVLSLGHCTQDKTIYDQLIIDCQKLGVSLMGHILDFDDQYPHLHPQIFAVNYQIWKKLKKPSWNYSGVQQSCISQDYVAADEKFHDAYTPLYIKPTKEKKTYNIKEMQVGAGVIKAMLETDLTVYNISETLRQRKWHLYPDQSWGEFYNFLQGKEYHGTNSSQQQYTSLLKHLAEQVQKQYYVLNTEPLTQINSPIEIDHYAGVASGIKLVCTMIMNGFNRTTSVTIFDFSDIALTFQKFLIDEWDGDFRSYQQLCKKFENAYPGYYPCLPSTPWEESYDYILSQLSLSSDQFQTNWKKYCALDHRFEKINLYDHKDQLKLANICEEYKNNYLWVSNAFYMEYSLITLGKKELETIRQGLLETLQEKTVILDTNDHWCQGLIAFNQQ